MDLFRKKNCIEILESMGSDQIVSLFWPSELYSAVYSSIVIVNTYVCLIYDYKCKHSFLFHLCFITIFFCSKSEKQSISDVSAPQPWEITLNTIR